MSVRLKYHALVYGLILAFALVGPAVFWRGGVLEREAAVYIAQYTGERPMLHKVFDPRANDLGTYQARELSYFVDYLDAQFYRLVLREFDVPLFIPMSALVTSLALVVVFMWGVRHVTNNIGFVAGTLLLGCLLSSFVFVSTMGIFYRSGKGLVAVTLLALLFHVRRVQQRRKGSEPTMRLLTRDAFVVFCLALVAGLLDRQGFFYVLTACVMLGVHYRWTKELRDLVAAFAVAAVVLLLYNFVIAPVTIRILNGYWPDFSYQRLPPREVLSVPIYAAFALAMLVQNALLVFGGIQFLAGLALIGLAGGLFYVTRQVARGDRVNHIMSRLRYEPDRRVVIYVVLAFGAQVLMFALMIARAKYIYFSLDHRYWYYAMPFLVTLLFAVLLALDAAVARLSPNRRWLVSVVLSVVILSNLTTLNQHRRTMRAWAWFGAVYVQSEAFRSSLRNGAPDPRLDGWYKPVLEYHLRMRTSRATR